MPFSSLFLCTVLDCLFNLDRVVDKLIFIDNSAGIDMESLSAES